MNYLFYTGIVIAFFIFALFIRTFRKKSLKRLFTHVKNREIFNAEREEAEKRGEKPFYFKRGKVVIYAKTQPQAEYKFREYMRKQKLQKNGLRK